MSEKTCQAGADFPRAPDCGQPATRFAAYRTTCFCWPKTKSFCERHAQQVEREWRFPHDAGLCPVCDGEIRFLDMKELAQS